ncbi:MAG: hypothetical protein QY323_02010 [Patescibacteria group bacterium]|nr:MAG: hypothetical protein QY323_02010 [Patescibacteria group bacterium]
MLKAGRAAQQRQLAVQVAEAGIEYYRWHLAHAPLDFQDGTGTAGPYVHEYKDASGEVIGHFALDITPPPVGSTVVTITSTGRLESTASVEEVIEVRMGKPSLAKYSVVANDEMNFGPGTEVFGSIHSNSGIRFDGLVHNVVTSAQVEYNDPDHSGSNEHGVHTHVFPTDPLPPATLPARTDVFEAGRYVGVPAIDFAGLSANLAQMKSDAQLDGRYFAASGALGYRIVFQTNDTFDLYVVNSVIPVPNGCTSVLGQHDWGTWSVNTQSFLQNYDLPHNGILFVEDNVWVEGQIDTARVTVAAARFPDNPAKRMHITVNEDLLYTNYDGQDVIALVAQGNFNVGMISSNTLRIDAALIAQNGRIGRYYYRPPTNGQNRCSPYHLRQMITLYGMIGTNERYGFAYSDGTGYQIRNIIYDGNLLYGPPPSFPLAADQYQTITWKRKRN